ncbi:MAG: division/cell wall cluster transcriptional repressor MraZ [Elusimicrobia bacterium]|nr:division/cell wall cluster transcriptional repressor MraZ [Elusimicrobiota bacterium]
MNPNFIGTYAYSIDTKNRLAIPAKFRQALRSQKELILSCGLEGCLQLYPLSSWARLGQKLEASMLRDKKGQRAFKRMLYANACNVELDEEGRILIPQNLILYALLKREAKILGVGEKIEIWSEAQWKKYERDQKTAFLKHASQLEIW